MLSQELLLFRFSGWQVCEIDLWWRHQMEPFSALLALYAGIHRSPVNSPHKGQWRGALMFSLICAWINGWVNNREAGDLRRHRAYYDVAVMGSKKACISIDYLRKCFKNEISNSVCKTHVKFFYDIYIYDGYRFVSLTKVLLLMQYLNDRVTSFERNRFCKHQQSTVCSAACLGLHQRKHQSSALLALYKGSPLVTDGLPTKGQ